MSITAQQRKITMKVNFRLKLPEIMQNENGDKTIIFSVKPCEPVHKCLLPGISGSCPGNIPAKNISVGDYICVKGIRFNSDRCPSMVVVEKIES